jgi:adenylate cyclase
MEIERKFLISDLPSDIDTWVSRRIEQGYICTDPVLRIRHSGDRYSFVYKSSGLLAHQEETFPLTEESYNHLSTKVDGKIIRKTRYVKPIDDNLKIELDVFDNVYEPDGSNLKMAEVEFPSVEAADAFTPPAWFGKDVTMDKKYHNSEMSKG